MPVPEIPAPMKPEREAGLYTTTFVVGWLTAMDSECKSISMNRRVNCTNGKIKIVESKPHDCTYVDESTVDCPATDAEKGEVRYVSKGFGRA